MDDISCHRFRETSVKYFIQAYDKEEKIQYIKANFPKFKNLEKIISSENAFTEEISTLSSIHFDEFLKEFEQFLNLQISQDINVVLKFCGFYLKKWESLDQKHSLELNKNLPKEETNDVTNRPRPPVEDTHKEIHKLQKTTSKADDEIIQIVEESVTQLGRKLTQKSYTLKSKIASFMSKRQKIVFKTFEESESYLRSEVLSKRLLCSLLHCFYDQSHTILSQTMLFSRYTWKELHEITTIGWDEKIPASTQELTILTIYAFFLESSDVMERYNFSDHPKTEHFLIGLTDASMQFHAYQIYLVSKLHDSENTRVQLLSSSSKTNKVHGRTVPFYKLTGLVEIFTEIKKSGRMFKIKEF